MNKSQRELNEQELIDEVGGDEIGITEVLRILNDSSAVILAGEDARPVIYPDVRDPAEDDGDILHLSWSDDRGYEFAVLFEETENQTARVNYDKGILLLHDNEGDLRELGILRQHIIRPSPFKPAP